MRAGILGTVAVVAALTGPAPALRAQIEGQTPPELEGIEIQDRAGATVPKDLVFRDEAGMAVRLGEYLDQGRPVMVQLVYFDCPMLCTLVLNGYVEGAKELDWTPGREYEVVSVSFNPADRPEVAAAKKENYVQALGRPEAGAGWHFLTGDPATVKTLADSLGFGYRWVESQKEFAHAAGMFVLTPGGRISRTLYGISFPAKDLKLSLVEASEGRLGSPLDHLVLYCFQWDPETHKYALVAFNVMKLAGLITVLGLGAFLAVQFTRERRHHTPRPAA